MVSHRSHFYRQNWPSRWRRWMLRNTKRSSENGLPSWKKLGETGEFPGEFIALPRLWFVCICSARISIPIAKCMTIMFFECFFFLMFLVYSVRFPTILTIHGTLLNSWYFHPYLLIDVMRIYPEYLHDNRGFSFKQYFRNHLEITTLRLAETMTSRRRTALKPTSPQRCTWHRRPLRTGAAGNRVPQK